MTIPTSSALTAAIRTIDRDPARRLIHLTLDGGARAAVHLPLFRNVSPYSTGG